jgi:hypothetical protein
VPRDSHTPTFTSMEIRAAKRWAVAVIFLFSISAFAQFGQRPFGGGGRADLPNGGRCLVPGYRGSGMEDLPTPRNIDRSGFVYARLRYHVQEWWRGGEVPWHHDYPDGDRMLPTALARLTAVYTKPESYQIVDIDSKELFKYPFVYLSEPGYLDLRPADVKNLHEYLERGGFVLVDDFRGNAQDNSEMENLVVQLKKLYPDRELVPLQPSHPIFHAFFDVDPTNMLPPYTMYNSGEVKFLGLLDDHSRLQMIVDFNNDTSEYWQALDIGQCSIRESGLAVELGINYTIYAMTH